MLGEPVNVSLCICPGSARLLGAGVSGKCMVSGLCGIGYI